MNLKTEKHTIIALVVFFVLLCLTGPIYIELKEGIHFSFQSMWVMLLPLLFGRLGTYSVAIYLILGALGLPIFSGFTGGYEKFLGVSGGFLYGFLISAWILQKLAFEKNVKLSSVKLLMYLLLGHIILLLIGFTWILLMGSTFSKVLAITLNLLPGLSVKLVIGLLIYTFTLKLIQRT